MCAREKYGWTWDWCWPHALHTAFTAATGGQKDAKACSNVYMRALLSRVKKVVEHVRKSGGNTKRFEESFSNAEDARVLAARAAAVAERAVNPSGLHLQDAPAAIAGSPAGASPVQAHINFSAVIDIEEDAHDASSIKRKQTAHLTSDVSQRWTSTITMLFNTLKHYDHVTAVYNAKKPRQDNPLHEIRTELTQVFSLVYGLGMMLVST